MASLLLVMAGAALAGDSKGRAFKPCADNPNTPEDESLFRSIGTCTGTRISETHVLYADHCRSPITDPSEILIWNDYEEMRALKPTRDFSCQDPTPFLQGVSSVPATAIYAPPLLPAADGSVSGGPSWVWGADLAILEVTGLAPEIPIARLANPADLEPGEDLFLIGLGTNDCYDPETGVPYPYPTPALNYTFGKAVFEAGFSPANVRCVRSRIFTDSIRNLRARSFDTSSLKAAQTGQLSSIRCARMKNPQHRSRKRRSSTLPNDKCANDWDDYIVAPEEVAPSMGGDAVAGERVR